MVSSVGFTLTLVTLVPEIVALKTIAAYRSGLDIDTHVSKEVAEKGLVEVLQGKTDLHVPIICLY